MIILLKTESFPQIPPFSTKSYFHRAFRKHRKQNAGSGLMEADAYVIVYSDDGICCECIDYCAVRAHSVSKFNFGGRDFSAHQVLMACFD